MKSSNIVVTLRIPGHCPSLLAPRPSSNLHNFDNHQALEWKRQIGGTSWATEDFSWPREVALPRPQPPCPSMLSRAARQHFHHTPSPTISADHTRASLVTAVIASFLSLVYATSRTYWLRNKRCIVCHPRPHQHHPIWITKFSLSVASRSATADLVCHIDLGPGNIRIDDFKWPSGPRFRL